MAIALINPNLIFQQNDPFTTGIVYMPISLAYVAASLRRAGLTPTLIDAFGQAPQLSRRLDNFVLLGLNEEQILERLPEDTNIVFVYAINLTSHVSTLNIIKVIKQSRPAVKVIALENTQAVTAYALKPVAEEFYAVGCDYILCGEADKSAVELAKCLERGAHPEDLAHIEGLGSPYLYKQPGEPIEELDDLPFPAWDLFPIENYWNLRFAHGPQSSKRYLPILSSRGCPYPCAFCVIPGTNKQRWRPRSPQNVVDEIEYFKRIYAVSEFHFEDLDPTIKDERTKEFCHELIKRKLAIQWKLVSGTKVETIKNEETVKLMAQAGCVYISISPETGSTRILKAMRKPFNLDHAIKTVHYMKRAGIRSQACFVLGFPSETKDDRELTRKLIWRLTKEGIDEIALFIITPAPGSAIFGELKGYTNLSELNFTPVWRSDYKELSRFRLRLYAEFLLLKLRYYPLAIIKQAWNFLRRRFETKMEMVPYRAMRLKLVGARR